MGNVGWKTTYVYLIDRHMKEWGIGGRRERERERFSLADILDRLRRDRRMGERKKEKEREKETNYTRFSNAYQPYKISSNAVSFSFSKKIQFIACTATILYEHVYKYAFSRVCITIFYVLYSTNFFLMICKLQ